MPSCVFCDPSLDERVRPVIAAVYSARPSEEELEEAAVIECDPPSAMVESTARWLRIRNELAADGLTPLEILRVFVRAVPLAYDVAGPTDEMLAWMFATASGSEVAREVCEHLITLGAAPVPPGARRWHMDRTGTVAIACLACGGELDPRFDRLFAGPAAPLPVVRALLGALPPERREALVLPVTCRTRNPVGILDWLLDIRDLVDAPAVAGVRARLIAEAHGGDRLESLVAEEACGAPRPVHSRPTPSARRALRYWRDHRVKERRAAELGPLAERVWGRRVIVLEAPELVSVAAWEAADDQRRRQIAEAAATALGSGFRLVGLDRFAGPPIAVLSRQGVRFCLVPGGSVEVGFSPVEEAEVRALAERDAWDRHGDDYAVLDQLGLMRPLTRVEVGPMVVAQAPSPPIAPHMATDELETSPLRLPSEAEWEYLARGGLDHQLTYRGPGVPESEEWFQTVEALGVDGANEFGLYGVGFQPEPCADVFHPGHDDLPVDGSPRRGAGPRVVKGGAANCYPWQGCGEWHLLLSAMRTPQTSWEFALSPRFVIGIQTSPA